MRFRMQLASRGGLGRVTNVDTGETYPCKWDVDVTMGHPNPFDPPRFIDTTETLIDITIEIDPAFFGSAPAAPPEAAPALNLPEPVLCRCGHPLSQHGVWWGPCAVAGCLCPGYDPTYPPLPQLPEETW